MCPKNTIIVLACALAVSDAFIDFWRAGRNTTFNHIKRMSGVHPDFSVDSLLRFEHAAEVIAGLPDNFDAREQWPNCPSLKEIRDQGACGSCWAFGASEVMADRICIASRGAKQFHVSAEDLLSCCGSECGSCAGGDPGKAWAYWQTQGLVSGGNYQSGQGCRPYSIPECPYFKTQKCENQETPTCIKQCEDGYNVDYKNDKTYGKNTYTLSGEEQIMAEIFQNGPVEATFNMYTDLLDYTTGIYRQSYGTHDGKHAVKMIGWGVENGSKFWLVANSWNVQWGIDGFFKMVRGEDHCGIESYIVAGAPDLDRSI